MAPKVGMNADFVPVFFDLETTGHSEWDEIIQIGAINKRNVFCRYVLPKRGIPTMVSALTGFTKIDNELHYRGQLKETTALKEALQDFLEYLRQYNKPIILVGHNCFSFDCRFMLKNYKVCTLLEEFSSIVQGFTDSLPLFKKCLPGKSSYKQEELVKEILGPDTGLIAHEAVSDSTALVTIFRKEKLTLAQIFEFSRSFDDVLKRENDRILAKKNLVTLGCLKPIVKESMLKKIAEAGLDMESLKRCLDAEGTEGLARYLSQSLEDGKPRVTRNKKSLEEICEAVEQCCHIARYKS